MADTLAAKILRDHVVGGEYAPGKELALRVDQVLSARCNRHHGLLAVRGIGP